MPDCIIDALRTEGLQVAYDQRKWYQRNDCLGWLSRAKLEATKSKRLRQMLDELRSGDVYMKMVWKPK